MMTRETWEAMKVSDRSFAWQAMDPKERDQFRELGGLTRQLIGLEGWRIEVTDNYGRKRRFIVGRSAGWLPCHIEKKRRDSMGGYSADRSYVSIRKLYQVSPI